MSMSVQEQNSRLQVANTQNYYYYFMNREESSDADYWKDPSTRHSGNGHLCLLVLSSLMPTGFPHSSHHENHKALIHTWHLNTHTQMQTTNVQRVCMNTHTKLQPKTHKNVHSHTETESLLIHSETTKSLNERLTDAHTLTYTHTDTIGVKPRRSKPEYSSDDVHPALPRIPL